MIRFLITIPRDLHGELKETAAQRGQTLTGLIRGIHGQDAARSMGGPGAVCRHAGQGGRN